MLNLCLQYALYNINTVKIILLNKTLGDVSVNMFKRYYTCMETTFTDKTVASREKPC